MDRADSIYTRSAPVSHEAEIEQALFALISAHANETAPFILYLADRIASHEIVTRMRLVPARTFSSSCRDISASLKAWDDA